MIRVKNLRVLLVAVMALSATKLSARPQESKPAEKPAEAPAPPPKEESSVTDHTIKIGGQTIPYKATAATILIKNDKDDPTALIYYTAYTRSDVKDMSQRPVAFLYNGGAGSAAPVVHMGSLGPRRRRSIQSRARPPPPLQLLD